MTCHDERYDIFYNGSAGRKYGALLYDYPKFSGGAKNYSSSAVFGRLGELVGTDNYVTNLKIGCTFSLLTEDFWLVLREMKRWLSGTGELVLSDSPNTFYRVQKVDYGNIERELRKYGRFSVDFTCIPYEYRTDGKREVERLTYNPYSESHPVYRITGNGDCVLTVNGKTMTATVGQNLTIDTDRMLAYRDRGELQNTSVSGDYEDLYLREGENEISVSDGFSLTIIPNWGYIV